MQKQIEQLKKDIQREMPWATDSCLDRIYQYCTLRYEWEHSYDRFLEKQRIDRVYKLDTLQFELKPNGEKTQRQIVADYVSSLPGGTKFRMRDIMSATGLTKAQIKSTFSNAKIKFAFQEMKVANEEETYYKPEK